jgi:O-antigen/teichoic acid export membrane protein
VSSTSDDRPAAPAGRSGRHANLLRTFAANIGILGLTVATGTINARLLGPTGRGELAAIQTVPSVLGMIALLGLPSAVGYFTARRPAEARSFTVTAAAICLVAAAFAMAVGYLLMPWALHSQPAVVIRDARFYLVFIALQGIVQLPFMALQGLGKFGIWNVLRLAPNVAALAAVLVAYGTGVVTSGRFSRAFLGAFSLIIPLLYVALWVNTRGQEPARFRHARDLLRYGLPSALMIPAGLLNLQLDQLMMAAWLPSKLLGLYAVSVSWSGLMSPAFSALGSMIFPALAATSDPEAQRAMVARTLRLAVLVVILLGIGLATVTPILLPLFFGRSFAPAVPTALMLVAAGMALNLNNLCGEVLRGLGVPRWPLYSQLAALPVTVTLLVLLLPRWTIFGAAVSSLAAYLVALAVCIAGLGRTCRLTARELLLPTRADPMVLWAVARRAMAPRSR